MIDLGTIAGLLAELVAQGKGSMRLPIRARCRGCGEFGRLQVRSPGPTRSGSTGWIGPPAWSSPPACGARRSVSPRIRHQIVQKQKGQQLGWSSCCVDRARLGDKRTGSSFPHVTAEVHGKELLVHSRSRGIVRLANCRVRKRPSERRTSYSWPFTAQIVPACAVIGPASLPRLAPPMMHRWHQPHGGILTVCSAHWRC